MFFRSGVGRKLRVEIWGRSVPQRVIKVERILQELIEHASAFITSSCNKSVRLANWLLPGGDGFPLFFALCRRRAFRMALGQGPGGVMPFWAKVAVFVYASSCQICFRASGTWWAARWP